MNLSRDFNKPHLTKEQRLPKCYKDAEKIIQKAKSCKINIKTALANSRFRGSYFKKVYALSLNVLKHYDYIQRIIEDIHLLDKENFLRRELASILIYEILFNNTCLRGASKPVCIIRKYKDAIFNAHKNLKDSLTQALIIPRYARVNTLLTTVDYVIKDLESFGFRQTLYDEDISEKEYLNLVKNLTKKCFVIDFHFKDLLVFSYNENLCSLKLYEDGHIFLQDKSSYIPVHVLNPEPGSTVIDACAAPGMKFVHIASKMKNKGVLIGCEKDKDRFSSLQEVVQYGGVKISKLHCTDFRLLDPSDSAYSSVNYILLDPSCSGSGMVNRMDNVTDTEDSKNKERLEKLAGFQVILLKHALKFPSVKRVVYSTCSVEEKENEYVVHEALNAFSESFKLIQAMPEWKEKGKETFEYGHFCLRAVSEKHLTNGFFVAVFERLENNNGAEIGKKSRVLKSKIPADCKSEELDSKTNYSNISLLKKNEHFKSNLKFVKNFVYEQNMSENQNDDTIEYSFQKSESFSDHGRNVKHIKKRTIKESNYDMELKQSNSEQKERLKYKRKEDKITNSDYEKIKVKSEEEKMPDNENKVKHGLTDYNCEERKENENDERMVKDKKKKNRLKSFEFEKISAEENIENGMKKHGKKKNNTIFEYEKVNQKESEEKYMENHKKKKKDEKASFEYQEVNQKNVEKNMKKYKKNNKDKNANFKYEEVNQESDEKEMKKDTKKERDKNASFEYEKVNQVESGKKELEKHKKKYKDKNACSFEYEKISQEESNGGVEKHKKKKKNKNANLNQEESNEKEMKKHNKKKDIAVFEYEKINKKSDESRRSSENKIENSLAKEKEQKYITKRKNDSFNYKERLGGEKKHKEKVKFEHKEEVKQESCNMIKENTKNYINNESNKIPNKKIKYDSIEITKDYEIVPKKEKENEDIIYEGSVSNEIMQHKVYFVKQKVENMVLGCNEANKIQNSPSDNALTKNIKINKYEKIMGKKEVLEVRKCEKLKQDKLTSVDKIKKRHKKKNHAYIDLIEKIDEVLPMENKIYESNDNCKFIENVIKKKKKYKADEIDEVIEISPEKIQDRDNDNSTFTENVTQNKKKYKADNSDEVIEISPEKIQDRDNDNSTFTENVTRNKKKYKADNSDEIIEVSHKKHKDNESNGNFTFTENVKKSKKKYKADELDEVIEVSPKKKEWNDNCKFTKSQKKHKTVEFNEVDILDVPQLKGSSLMCDDNGQEDVIEIFPKEGEYQKEESNSNENHKHVDSTRIRKKYKNKHKDYKLSKKETNVLQSEKPDVQLSININEKQKKSKESIKYGLNKNVEVPQFQKNELMCIENEQDSKYNEKHDASSDNEENIKNKHEYKKLKKTNELDSENPEIEFSVNIHKKNKRQNIKVNLSLLS